MQKGENLSSILKPMVKKADYAGVSLIPGQADGDKKTWERVNQK